MSNGNDIGDNMQLLRSRLPDDSFAAQLVEAVAGESEPAWKATLESLVSEHLSRAIQELQTPGQGASGNEV